MKGWIRNVDSDIMQIQSEIKILIEENNLLRDKCSLLENKVIFLQSIIDANRLELPRDAALNLPSGISGPI